MKNPLWPIFLALLLGAFLAICLIESTKAEAVPGIAAGPDQVKIFTGTTDGNQNEKMALKINDWLKFNEKNIEVLRTETAVTGTYYTVISIWYRGAAKDNKPVQRGFEKLPIPPDPIEQNKKK